MKKVILFLCLLPMFGYGQVKLNDGSTVTTKFIGKDAQPISIGAHPLRNVQQSQPKIYNEATPKVLSLEEKLLLYAQECWEDSTLQQVPYVCFPGCMVNHYPEWKYVHREPTFMGFIEFLKRK